MKKILLFAAVAMAAVSVNAQDWNATNSGPLPVGTTILDNDYVTVVTAVQDSETALIKNESDQNDPKTYAGFTFTKYVNIRVDAAPAADNEWAGTAYGDATPMGISLVVTAKKNTDMTLYYKHGDGKTLSCISHTGKAVSVEETAVESLSGYYTGLVKLVEGQKYTIYARGGTTGLNGISTAETPAAEEITDGVQVTTTWTMSDPEAINSESSVASAIADTKATLGDGLTYAGTVTWSNITFTKVQPTDSDKGTNSYSSASSMKKYIDFEITPAAKYQITKVEFDVIKIGTGDPTVFVDFVNNEGKTSLIGDNLPIRRNNDSETTEIRQVIEAKSEVSDQPVSVRIYVGKCANNKQVGIANVVITGVSAISTGITAVNAEMKTGAAYNLAGQKVSSNFKGIVLKDGKKVVVK